MSLSPRALVPMYHVKDVELSIKFYERLGFAVGNTFVPPGATAPAWAWLESGRAQLMVTRADEPVIPSQQAVLFYLYYDDVPATRTALSEAARPENESGAGRRLSRIFDRFAARAARP